MEIVATFSPKANFGALFNQDVALTGRSSPSGINRDRQQNSPTNQLTLLDAAGATAVHPPGLDAPVPISDDAPVTQRTNEIGQPVGDAVPDWKGAQAPVREVMEGRYCRVVPLDGRAHAADLFDAYREDQDGRTWTYVPYGPFATREALDVWVARLVATDDPLCFAIVDGRTGRAAGVASYMRIKPAHGVIEVGGIVLAPALQRTRAATEAMYLMMARAFNELGYRRYEWKCDALNAPSRRAAERLGFTYDGLFEQAWVYKGRNRDTAWYSVLDRDWPVLERAYRTWLSPANFDEEGRQRRSLAEVREP